MHHVDLKIKRQDNIDGLSYWEEFRIPYSPGMNVIAVLMAIREAPTTAEGLPTTPVVWEQNCLEEMCGSCAMVINGRVRLACTTLVEGIDQPIVLEPLSKFPVVRDLKVDRSSMFEALNKLQAWSDLDGLHDHAAVCINSAQERDALLTLSACIACGACLEACPQINDRSPFVGAFAVAQVLLVNERHPNNKQAGARLHLLKGPGGMGGCSNAQTCKEVCPKSIPLSDAIGRIQWDITKHALSMFFKGYYS